MANLLSFDKKRNKFLCFVPDFSYLCNLKALPRSVAGVTRHERKVRAAQGAPLLKVEAIGDSR